MCSANPRQLFPRTDLFFLKEKAKGKRKKKNITEYFLEQEFLARTARTPCGQTTMHHTCNIAVHGT